MGAFDYYDVQGGAAGQASPLQPEERQMQRIRRMVQAAEHSNYDGDPEYYNQIKAIAMQAGIPIKSFRTNPYRLAKAGILGMADTMTLGLVPNDWYEPMNTAESVAAGVGGAAGMFAPYSAAGNLAKFALGGLGATGRGTKALAMKALGQSGYKQAAQKYQGIGSLMKNLNKRKGNRFMSGTPQATTTAAAPTATATATATKGSKYVSPYKSPGGAKPKTATQKAADAKSKAATISAGAAKVTKTTAMSVEAFAKLAKRNVAKAKAILRSLGVKTGKTSNPRILAAKFRQYKARNK